MTDELGRELGAWLRTIDVRPADPATSLRRSMANVERTPQVSRSRLAAVLARQPIPTEPIGDPSIHQHSRRIGQDRPVHVTTRGTSRVFITATAMAVTTAFVLAGSLLLSGTVEGPTDPPVGASPAPATESPSPLASDETGADDLFELTLTAPRSTWSADEPIEFSATLTYIGEEPEVTVIGAGSGLVAFGVEQLDGPVDMEPGWRLSAREYDFAQGDGIDVPFTKSGGFDPEDPMAGFWGSWFDDPELRLPAGEYILSAVASYGLPDAPNGLWTDIGAELPIEVVDDPTPPLGASPAPATAVAESPEPTAPVASAETAASLPVPELGIGSPTMSAERDGLLLEVWLDHTSLPVGGRLNALVRVSNTGTSDVEWQTNICGTGPAETTIAPARPPDTGVEWTGQAATFKRLLLDNELAPAQLWDASTIDLENVGCDAYSAIRRFEPGSTAEMTVAWDAVDRPGRPIVPGPATVTSTFESWTPRKRPAEPSDPSQELVASTTIDIVGEMGPEVPIGRYADIALSDDTFRTWVETRTARPRSWDPYADYWPNDDGTYPDDPRYERATAGTVDIGMFVDNGPRGEVTIDLATLEVLGSKLDGRVKVNEDAAAATSAGATAATDLGGTWRPMARAPFGGVGVPGGWTGEELIVIDPEGKRQAAAYDPSADAWQTIARPSWKVGAYTPAHWTGTELVFVESRHGTERGFAAYDPATDSWRVTAPGPIGDITASAEADGVIVAASGGDLAAAVYDPVVDTWTALLPVPAEPADAMPVGHTLVLFATDAGVYALSAPPGADATFSIARLDPATGTWSESSSGPISALAGIPLWTGEAFVFRSYPLSPNDPGDGHARDGRYDPTTDMWTVETNDCGIDTSDAVWTGSLILAATDGLAFDPAADECYTLPAPPRVHRSRPLRVWTGTELLAFSGNSGEESPALRDGIVYRPPA